MHGTRSLLAASALAWMLSPLGAAADSNASRLAHEGVLGTDLAAEIASGAAKGLSNADHGKDVGGTTSPVPEPSSLLLFAVGLFIASAVAKHTISDPTR